MTVFVVVLMTDVDAEPKFGTYTSEPLGAEPEK